MSLDKAQQSLSDGENALVSAGERIKRASYLLAVHETGGALRDSDDFDQIRDCLDLSCSDALLELESGLEIYCDRQAAPGTVRTVADIIRKAGEAQDSTSALRDGLDDHGLDEHGDALESALEDYCDRALAERLDEAAAELDTEAQALSAARVLGALARGLEDDSATAHTLFAVLVDDVPLDGGAENKGEILSALEKILETVREKKILEAFRGF